jgi:hypothetical protein
MANLGVRITKLERAASAPGDMVAVAPRSEEQKAVHRAVLATYGMTPKEIEAHLNRRYVRRSDMELVARLSPVEREQRLLAIRQSVADQPAAGALWMRRWRRLEHQIGILRAAESPSPPRRAYAE